jgi:hypothetical protein
MDYGMKDSEEIRRNVQERDDALAVMDMEWARKNMPYATSDEVRIIAMHKARYECTNLSNLTRQQSKDWLSSRGYSRIDGSKFLPDGEFPD